MVQKRRIPVKLELPGTGPVDLDHRRYTPLARSEQLNRQPGSGHPGFQTPAWHLLWQAKVKAALKQKPRNNAPQDARRMMRRPKRR